MEKETKETFAMLGKIAFAAEQAAMRSGKDREFSALCEVIERQEKEHRSFGRRLVGSRATKGRFSVRRAVDYFVSKVLADGHGRYGFAWERQLKALDGLRDDYVKGAILMANEDFREAFRAELCKAFNTDGEYAFRKLWNIAEQADYSTLVGES
jgi:hypothetical protein